MRRITKKGKEIELVTSWDDGCLSDLRLAELLRKYKLPAIFYIPVKCELSKHDICVLAKDFDIGGHTINHKILRGLDPDEAYCELKDSKDYLEDLTGQKIHSLCYPRGRYDNSIINIVQEIGYKEARTTKVLNIFKPTDPFEIETSVHVYNRKEYDGVDWLNTAMVLFNKVIRPSGRFDYFHLWGHSWEISKFDYWKDLELLFSYIRGNLK